MKQDKLLYLTDQAEYSQQGTINSFFKVHLAKYFEIHIVYIAKFKYSFQAKGNDYIVPQHKQEDIIAYLDKKGIDIQSFSYVFIRNRMYLLKSAIKHRKQFGYKVGFRISYPKNMTIYEIMNQKRSAGYFKKLLFNYKQNKDQKLINEADIFLPTSREIRNEFYPKVKKYTFSIFNGIDPKKVSAYSPSKGDKTIFVYCGTVDPLRGLDVSLDALSELSLDKWELVILSSNIDFANELVSRYPSLKNNIKVVRTSNLDELGEELMKCDVGIGLLPDVDIYNTTVPAKVFDFYTYGMPTVLSDNSKNKKEFDEDEAFFCLFEKEDIKKTFSNIVSMPKSKIKEIGKKGQDKLINSSRNYEKMAKVFFDTMKKEIG